MTSEPALDLAALPPRLFAKDMAAVFRVSLARFYALEGEGAFLFAECRPRIGRKAWSRDRVAQYFAGTLTSGAWPRTTRLRLAKRRLKSVG